MARKTVIVSDITGEPLDTETAVRVSITQNGERYELDANRKEVQHLIQVGRKSKTRGRKKKATVNA